MNDANPKLTNQPEGAQAENQDGSAQGASEGGEVKTLLKRLVGWCLALLGWSVSLVFRLVDWVMYPKAKATVTPPLPPLVPTPDRFDQESAHRIADEFLVMDLLYEVCDDWEANHG